MHYCQVCDVPTKLSPSGECPTASCTYVDASVRTEPVFFLTGASGVGKTTLLPALVASLRGECLVFDMDSLIDPLARTGPVDWETVYDLWLHVAAGVAQNGLPALVLGSFMPEHLARAGGRRWVGDAHFAALDCVDDERIARCRDRPQWRTHDEEAQSAFAGWLRSSMSPVFDTTSATPASVAEEVAAWVRASR